MKAKFSNSILSIASWNVNGLEYKSHGMKCNKLDYPEVVNSLKTLDCIRLMEHTQIKMLTFLYQVIMFLEKIELNIKKACKPSGGVAVLVKESMRNAYKFDPIFDSDIIG